VWGAAILALAPKFIWWMIPVLGRHDNRGALHGTHEPRQPRTRAARARLAGDTEESAPPPNWAALSANLAAAETTAAGR